ncbi:MAG: nuclear transport factor 2 family protein [Ramlibacter sp.]|nr:nuclear transport factor 2 family protein [Ramlibacter sp.]
MNPIFKGVIAAVAVVAAVGAAAQSPAQTVRQLTKQADDWDKAIVRKDKSAIANNMSADFRQIDGAGDIETKASFLESVLDAKLTIDPYTVEDFEVRVYGDVALLSGRTRMTGAYEGKPFSSHYRYIDIYVRKAGAWRVASVQITKLKN